MLVYRLRAVSIRGNLNLVLGNAYSNSSHWIAYVDAHGATHASPLLGTIIGSFKSAVSHRIRQQYNISHLWQRNYYEHILRDEADWNLAYRYVDANPMNWDDDEENPVHGPRLRREDPP